MEVSSQPDVAHMPATPQLNKRRSTSGVASGNASLLRAWYVGVGERSDAMVLVAHWHAHLRQSGPNAHPCASHVLYDHGSRCVTLGGISGGGGSDTPPTDWMASCLLASDHTCLPVNAGGRILREELDVVTHFLPVGGSQTWPSVN